MHTDFFGWKAVEEMKKSKKTNRIVKSQKCDHTLRPEFAEMVNKTIFNFQRIKQENDEGLLMATLLNFATVLPSFLTALSQDYEISDEATDTD
jgi:hypothetical protein